MDELKLEKYSIYMHELNEVFNVQIEEYVAQFNRNEWEKDRVWLKEQQPPSQQGARENLGGNEKKME